MDVVSGLVLESASYSVSKHVKNSIGVYIVLVIDSKHFNALV